MGSELTLPFAILHFQETRIFKSGFGQGRQLLPPLAHVFYRRLERNCCWAVGNGRAEPGKFGPLITPEAVGYLNILWIRRYLRSDICAQQKLYLLPTRLIANGNAMNK